MIQFTLKCDEGHRFESWFQSADAFDKLKGAGLVSCAVCGSDRVEKALMAPAVRTTDKPVPAPGASPTPLSAPASPAEQAMADLRRKIEQNSDYVGMKFAQEARAIHEGTAPERAIYGEARPDEAKKLIEDGVPVAPLPFIPGRKSN
ncbi:DUF1178 family protein [Lutimaribacter sp. EGI FJ00015]|uniref:DUF1178 family protein n=1 Tax=Lutimaribacter degradans TaxID=2945989 RepID=A0ACC5ZSS1_9RHOB|nr:DUF1178 family protein [Lutimaribacter sp. EGI FJ00013]MCM2561383.1 DUF1178 family protein [Lutimaribacter sp. EGI FJ00013]MCO0612907.1 DUF1178 family protein [Lutimaribacter sp. EGI FJ00015]MCO0635565.1 DUF1178 family protein [Lutimaribacter sp. EGI FJ00014]